MGRKKLSPYFTPPRTPILLSLPPELLHTIFEWLEDQGDVLSLRLTCSLLATIGLDHFGDEMPLVFHRDKLNALTEIAGHPVLAKRMRSLFYICDRLVPSEYDEWDRERPSPKRQGIDVYSDLPNVISSDREERMIKRDVTRFMRESNTRRAAVPESDLTTAFANFEALCHDQTVIDQTTYDTDCLRQFFEGCSNVREVTIALQAACARRLNASSTAFNKTVAIPFGNKCWQDVGVREVRTVVEALAGTNDPKPTLESLTLVCVSHRLFGHLDAEGYLHEDEDECDECSRITETLKSLFRPLRRLRMYIKAEADEFVPMEEIDDISEEASMHLKGHSMLNEILTEARGLRVLKLQMPTYDDSDYETYGQHWNDVDISRVLKTTHFPHLYDIAIGSCSSTAIFLVTFLLQHKETLRRLSLSQLRLRDPHPTTWLKQVFTPLAGQLPLLRKIKLRGYFDINFDTEFDFDFPSGESRRIAPIRDAVENYVLNGGPELLEEDLDALPVQTCYPWEQDGYERPGLPDDDMPADDPARDYDSDDFDLLV